MLPFCINFIYMYYSGCQQTRAGSGGKFLTRAELEVKNKTLMDFLPKPEGSWESGYAAFNNRANIMLGTTAVFFVLTLLKVSNSMYSYILLTRSRCFK